MESALSIFHEKRAQNAKMWYNIDMIQRIISKRVRALVREKPVTHIEGTRSCGKTTLLQSMYPEYRYLTMNDIRIRNYASVDPFSFLEWAGDKVIIDDVHNCPKLVDAIYENIQSDLSENGSTKYSYILTTPFAISEGQESPSFVGYIQMLPLAWYELSISKYATHSFNEWIIRGGYPRIHKEGVQLNSAFFIENAQKFIEHDAAIISRVNDPLKFLNFARALANMLGDHLDVKHLALVSDISTPTVRKWLKVLQQMHIIFLQKPFQNTFSKRITKSPRIYFYDTGLACALLALSSPDQVQFHPKRNALFQCMLLSERIKFNDALGEVDMVEFWHDTHDMDIHAVFKFQGELHATITLAVSTPSIKHRNQLARFAKMAGIPLANCRCVYLGKEPKWIDQILFVPWRNYIFDRVRNYVGESLE
jgi:predicted AAA+ superfamily ATPase